MLQIQLTFSTAASAGGRFYSLYLKFPEECALCVEESKVDVGVENVVVLGRKAEESRVTWERFEVGSTSTQTTVSCVCVWVSFNRSHLALEKMAHAMFLIFVYNFFSRRSCF